MLYKSQLIETIESFEEEIEIDDIIEKLILLNKFDISEKQIDKGESISHEELEMEILKWEQE